MSDQTPHDTTPAASPPDDSTTAAAGTGGGAGRKIGFGVAGALAVAAVAGGAYAYTQLSGGGAQPHDVLPADTFAYVRLDLDPSASQKVDLFRLAKRVPELSKELGIDDEEDDLRKIVLEDVVGSCDGVEYDRDIEPWLGERIGLGVGPQLTGDVPEDIRIAVQVSDEDAARDGIAKLFACDDEEFGIAFLDGYAIVTPSQKSADAAVKAAEEEPLADVESFARTQDALDEQGVLSGWVDVAEAVEVAKDAGAAEALGEDAAELDTITDEVSDVAFALSASSTSLRLDTVARQGDEPTDVPEIRGLGALPEDTVVGLTLPGGGKAVEENWDELKSSLQDLLELGPALGIVPGLSGGAAADPFSSEPPVEFDADAYAADPEGYQEEYLRQLEGQSSAAPSGGADVDETIEQIEQTLDVTLPEDLVTFLGDALTVYVGSEGLETLASAQGPSDPSDVSSGLVLEGDTTKAADLAGRLVATVQELVGVEIATADSDDAVSLATSPEVAEALVEDGGLSGTDLFSSVIEDEGAGGLFVDVGTLLDAIAEAAPGVAEDETFTSVRDNLDAVGISGTRPDDGYVGFGLAVAFTEKD